MKLLFLLMKNESSFESVAQFGRATLNETC